MVIKTQKNKRVMAIYLDLELHKRVTSLANTEHRSQSGQVAFMIKEYLKLWDESTNGSINIGINDELETEEDYDNLDSTGGRSHDESDLKLSTD